MFVIYKVFFILYMINKHLFKRDWQVFRGNERRGGRAGRALRACAGAWTAGRRKRKRESPSDDGCRGSQPVRAQGSGAGPEVARGATERAPPPGTPPPAPRRVPSSRRSSLPPALRLQVSRIPKAATERSAEEGCPWPRARTW